MSGAAFLKGDVVDLCTIERNDVEFLHRLVNHPRVRPSVFSYAPLNRAQEREWVESVGEDDEVRLLVRADGDPAGTVGLNSPNVVWGTAEVGYMIDPDHWGNGYATDAVSRLCQYAFEERRLNKVYAKVYATNPASRRVLEKVGFVEEGRLRAEAFVEGEYVDVHRYGLLAAERANG